MKVERMATLFANNQAMLTTAQYWCAKAVRMISLSARLTVAASLSTLAAISTAPKTAHRMHHTSKQTARAAARRVRQASSSTTQSLQDRNASHHANFR